jgi:hypothetical protein
MEKKKLPSHTWLSCQNTILTRYTEKVLASIISPHNGKQNGNLHEEIEYRVSGQLSHEAASALRRTVLPGFVQCHAEKGRLDNKNANVGVQRAAVRPNRAKKVSRN